MCQESNCGNRNKWKVIFNGNNLTFIVSRLGTSARRSDKPVSGAHSDMKALDVGQVRTFETILYEDSLKGVGKQ